MATRLLLGTLLGFLLVGCGNAQRGTSLASGDGAGCKLALVRYGLCATVQWNEAPKARQVSTGTLRFLRKTDGTAVDPAATPGVTVAIRMDMPEHGHPGPTVRVSRIDDSVAYRVTNADFFMAGLWHLVIELTDGTGKVLDATTLAVTL